MIKSDLYSKLNYEEFLVLVVGNINDYINDYREEYMSNEYLD